jgi:hypothetical protein
MNGEFVATMHKKRRQPFLTRHFKVIIHSFSHHSALSEAQPWDLKASLYKPNWSRNISQEVDRQSGAVPFLAQLHEKLPIVTYMHANVRPNLSSPSTGLPVSRLAPLRPISPVEGRRTHELIFTTPISVTPVSWYPLLYASIPPQIDLP